MDNKHEWLSKNNNIEVWRAIAYLPLFIYQINKQWSQTKIEMNNRTICTDDNIIKKMNMNTASTSSSMLIVYTKQRAHIQHIFCFAIHKNVI